MKAFNRRTFLNLSAVSAGAMVLGTSGCTPLSTAEVQIEETTTENVAVVTEPDEAASAVVDGATFTTEMAEAANHFLAGLDEQLHGQATYAFDNEERFRWHWTTPGRFPRNGVPLRDMNEEQKVRALDLLKASLSGVGLEKAQNIMSLQRDLGNDPELYYVTIFGAPGGDEPWGWRWEGHHLSHHFTIVGDTLATTPFFHGAWPTNTQAGLRAMPREEDAGLELVNSLNRDALATALFQQNTLRQHVTQNAATVNPLEPLGLLYSDMTDGQQKLVAEIIQTYLETQPDHIAEPSMARINESGLETIRFAWAGSMAYQNPQYYRLQGPTFLLEFDNSRNGGTHIHSVWRDFERDFGSHLF